MMKSDLAINGGTPIRTKPWSEPNAIGSEERAAVDRVFSKKHLSLFQGAFAPAPPYSFLGGTEVQALEREMQEYTGIAHAVAVNSATSGLYAAIGALGLGPGDEVIVSPYTMSACAVAPLVYGAIPIFADVRRETGSLDPASVRKRITERTKAILVVHQFGIPADMEAIMTIAKERSLRVIEDCAQAWGATYKGSHVGAMGDIGVFSFNVHKTIQCGEGGVCVTGDDELKLRLQLIRNHGEAVVEDAGYDRIENTLGFNYRMTELQAAIAREQLKRLDGLNAARVRMAERFYKGIAKHSCFAVPVTDERTATYYVCPFRFLADRTAGVPRKELNRMLAAEGIPFSEGYVKPLYLLPLFTRKTAFRHGYPWTAPENRASRPDYRKGSCPTAELLYEQELLFSSYICHPQTERDIDDMIAAVDKVLGGMLRSS